MALISVLLIISGFILSVLCRNSAFSLTNKIRTASGEVSQSKVNFYSVLMILSVLMVIAGVLGYYWLRGNLPYYING